MRSWEEVGGMGVLLSCDVVCVFVSWGSVVCGVRYSPACGGRLLF